MKTRIELGEKPEIVASTSPNEDAMYYPRIHIRGGEELEDFPEEGTMVVEFRRVSVTTTEEGEKTRVMLCLEAKCICEVEAVKNRSKAERKKTEDELDRLFAEAEAESETEDAGEDEETED